jgi:hypothetical protein
MTPLDLRTHRPRGPREPLLGFYFLARTVDKLRAELPGGDSGAYVNHDTGFSAYVVRRLGLSMDEVRAAVAGASSEDDVAAWLAARIDLTLAPALNAKLESFVVERMSAADRVTVRARHPVMAVRPELAGILDILAADDELTYAGG